MTRASLFVDDSDNYLAIIIGYDLVVGSRLNRSIKRHVGKTVHMRELSRSLKLSTARLFTEIACKLSESYDLRLFCGYKNTIIAWLSRFIETSIKEKRVLPNIYVDKGIEVLLREKIHPYYFRFLTIYIDKDKTLCADILAWINLRRAQNSFIWSKIATHIMEISDV
jgi:hypothetical protein